jgi:hypothetical protein
MRKHLVTAVAVVSAGALIGAGAANATTSSATTAAKKTSISKQIAALKKSLKSNAATGKKNTASIKTLVAAGKTIDAKISTLTTGLDSANKATTALSGKVDAVVSVATDALTKLQAGLVQVGDGLKSLAASYTNFEYGVVQLSAGATAIPGAFLATPRLDPTVEQATVTGQFPCLPAALGGVCTASALHANVAVRSANPSNDSSSKVYCRITASQVSAPTGATAFVTSKPNADFGGAPAYQVARSPIAPDSDAEKAVFPLSMVSTDQQVDLTGSTNSANSAGGAGGFTLGTALTGGGMINVTLSCLTVPNQS